MNPLRAPTQEQAGKLIAMAAVLFGGWIRLFIPQIAGFPVNDGGLFYVMVRELQANGLHLPMFVHYNGLSIPFAYPPLGFYAGAMLANGLHVDPIRILQWLPAITLIGTLPAFYGLARAVLGTGFGAGLATLVYAFTPRAITWQIMGGGLTRSFGQLFLILALTFIYQTFTSYGSRRLTLAILFSALVVLSHPEAALQTAAIAALFWLFEARTTSGTVHALTIGAGALALSAIWWLPAVIHHGAGTLLSAAQTGQHYLLAVLQPLLLNFVDEPLLSLVAVFGMIGFAAEVAKRRFLVPAWLFVPFLAEPRSAPTFAMISLALLAGVGLADVVLPGIARLGGTAENPLRSGAASLFLVFVSIYMFGQTAVFGTQLAQTKLTAFSIEAFNWVKTNTPAGSRFMILTGNTADELFCDAPTEWFPALTDRVSVTTIQGREWQQGNQFNKVVGEAQAVSACISSGEPLSCVTTVVNRRGSELSFDYIYVGRNVPRLQNCRATGISSPGERLIDELNSTSGYLRVYENADAAVFQVR